MTGRLYYLVGAGRHVEGSCRNGVVTYISVKVNLMLNPGQREG